MMFKAAILQCCIPGYIDQSGLQGAPRVQPHFGPPCLRLGEGERKNLLRRFQDTRRHHCPRVCWWMLALIWVLSQGSKGSSPGPRTRLPSLGRQLDRRSGGGSARRGRVVGRVGSPEPPPRAPAGPFVRPLWDCTRPGAASCSWCVKTEATTP